MLPCLMKKFFGFECFGCGLQRSVLLLAQGEFVAAFKMYPALYPLLLLLGTIVLEQFTRLKYFKEMVWSLGSLTAFFMVGNYMWKHFL